MTYKERELSECEHFFALRIRESIPRAERLRFVQHFCDVQEDQRDRANEAALATSASAKISEENRKRIWKALDFPRYRFFDVALPNEGWANFAESE